MFTERRRQHLRPEQIAAALSRDTASVARSVGRLWRAGYLDAADASTMEEEYYAIRRLTPSGLRECGAWPRDGHLADALIVVLEREATEVERIDPEMGRKIRQIAEIAGDLGTSYLAKLSAELLKAVSLGP